MSHQKRTEYYLVFTFENHGDMIQYITLRECTSLDDMIGYCDDWIVKFGDYYGACIQVEIYEKCSNYVLVYDSASYE